ncbi:toll-like receptor 13 [Salvelinus fontinalis]|uniref:toll-like receptor 13 n=1 Tax=Salvelinus fontinalis TaxID=8038 RepID=UPI002485B9F5|nr:toll-like receptor 13 [Salvelinus fontinalis]
MESRTLPGNKKDVLIMRSIPFIVQPYRQHTHRTPAWPFSIWTCHLGLDVQPRPVLKAFSIDSVHNMSIKACLRFHHCAIHLSYSAANCSLDVGFVLFLSTSVSLLLFLLVVLLRQLAREYLLAFCHIILAWLEAVRRPNPRGRYCYDAFVSYSGRDERWVVEQLLPGMEQKEPPFLRLCLHSRDFQLGKDIVDNITDSLYGSHYTVCVVSRNYLRSNWCSLCWWSKGSSLSWSSWRKSPLASCLPTTACLGWSRPDKHRCSSATFYCRCGMPA